MSVRVGDEIVAGGQGDMYTKAQVDALIASAIAQTTEKPGMIKPFAGTTVPTGYLLCDGSAVSRTTYANLFAAIGTTYGSGDGSTTFNLPDLYDRHILYRTTGTPGIKGEGSVPNIIGDFAFATGVNGGGTWLKADYAWGAITKRGSGNTAVLGQSSTFSSTNSFRFDASQYNSAIYGTGANSAVYGRHIQMKAIIKY